MTDVPLGGRAASPPVRRGRVLVTDLVNGRSRSAVAAVRALAAGGFSPVVTTSGRSSPARSSRDCRGAVRVPDADQAGYVDAVRTALHDSSFLGIMPASDGALLALGLPGADLVDKATLPGKVAASGLRMPETSRFDDHAHLAASAGHLHYPLVVKPVTKSGPGSLARRVESPPALASALSDFVGPVVVQPFLDGPLRAVAGVIHDGQLLALVHQRYVRTWPADCGVASAAATSEPDRDLEDRLPHLLGGHAGVFQVQLVGDWVIDVNPRVYGSLPLAVASGVNLPAIACAAAAGEVNDLVRGRVGVRYRWLEGDVRRLALGVRRGELRPGDAASALIPRRGTAHSVESMRDPAPMFNRLLYASRWGSR